MSQPLLVKKPRITTSQAKVEHILEVAKDSYYYPIIHFVISTGLRQAKIIGLKFRDLDFDTLSINVNHVLYTRNGVTTSNEPKTSYSRR
jgi:integrase